MTKKKVVTTPSQVLSSSDALSFFRHQQNQGCPLEIDKVGEVQYKVSMPGKGSIHINDNPVVLPKEQRNLLLFWIFCFGFVTGVLLIATFPIWYPVVQPLLV